MDELAISVKIADRPFKMTVNVEEEEVIRKAARLINEKIEKYANTYAFNDIQDLLSMVSLSFATNALKAEAKAGTANSDLLPGLKALEKTLSEELEEKHPDKDVL
ncbi:MAG: cell division protein ZapA [Bacteroidales bacterium]|nr:cell division protein ZapA [Bacteroidales bacterium]